ncbi:MAG: YdcF family protein [Pyrinomonadaceae bacterium]
MGWHLKIFLSLLILFVGWVFLAPLLAKGLILEKPLAKANAIVVLSGSSAYVERTHRAAKAYREGVSQKIVLTDDGAFGGWSQAEQRNPRFVELARKELIAKGVSPEDIEILEPVVSGTIFEARLLVKKIKKEKWTKVLLVTSRYHSRRALWSFDKTAGQSGAVFGIVSANSEGVVAGLSTWWLTPRGWRLVAGEYMKLVGYWLFY